MTGRTIWAPWRMAYITDDRRPAANDECLFCRIGNKSADDRANLVLGRFDHAFVMLNRYPYSSGHLMVVPRAHVDRPEALAEPEYIALMLTFRLAVSRLQAALSPQGMNTGINLGRAAGAGIADHLHIHLVPRWEGDHNFMPVIADTMVMPQYLNELYDILWPYFKLERTDS
ncbi:MAG: HIT domain-containing protein [Deltaproteobacteria bacterium]|nr:HIT domain-containing protein [Candidatus Anaeroferrophillacea bacterium]